jgi:hypothetical protein
MDGELRVRVAEEGADAERLDAVTSYLRNDLVQLDVEDVAALPAGPPPPGARALDAGVIGGLLVTLGNSAEGLRSVVTVIRDWLRRGDGVRRSVRLELDGDALELSEASAYDQERLIRLFVSRHDGPRGGGPGRDGSAAGGMAGDGPAGEEPERDIPAGDGSAGRSSAGGP